METKEKKSLFSKLVDLDRRILYWFLIVFIIVPFLKPLGLPLGISEMTRKAYNTIDSLPEGSVVMVGPIPPSYSTTLTGGGIAIMKHLLRKNIKIIFWGTDATAGPQHEWAWGFLEKDLADKTYGVDYVNLGYVSGAEAAYTALANDFQSAVKKDYYGNDIQDMSLTKDIRGAVDIALVTDSTGGATPLYYTRHWYEVYGTPYVSNCISLMYPMYVPYVASGQIAGMLNGLRGGAEYEYLINTPGSSIASMDAMSTSNLLIIFFVLIGNIAEYFIKSKKEDS